MNPTYFPSSLLQYSSEPSRNRNGNRIVFSSSSSRRQKNPKCVTTRLAGIIAPSPVRRTLVNGAPKTAVLMPPVGKITPFPVFHRLDISHPGRTEKENVSRLHSRCSGTHLPFGGKKFCPQTLPVRRVEIHTTRNIFFRCMVLLSFLCRFTA